ncbi:Spo0E family sporulation regulatory protein-aspartic acid phosphatase [Peribacillus frigoritolerans]|uniref:Spo0E family sporulation regulatory protein-aspartic acid phosphatase n=1 Tax=Peribacillus frigoritolerans TaxID=450367 RepID=UPI002E1D8442|nr:Spo0E family sporulation regulatory protein-aspartic acid phosphatase [Peribacillus frigoritolerans]MED3993587.1 Spo0E family sporulation regulatory protein-aspartic acid phosphatase [Peribacillus frigoritolerans]
MILKRVLELSKMIDGQRQDMYMYVLTRVKGTAHPEVIKISQHLNEDILRMQNIIEEINPRHQTLI